MVPAVRVAARSLSPGGAGRTSGGDVGGVGAAQAAHNDTLWLPPRGSDSEVREWQRGYAPAAHPGEGDPLNRRRQRSWFRFGWVAGVLRYGVQP